MSRSMTMPDGSFPLSKFALDGRESQRRRSDRSSWTSSILHPTWEANNRWRWVLPAIRARDTKSWRTEPVQLSRTAYIWDLRRKTWGGHEVLSFHNVPTDWTELSFRIFGILRKRFRLMSGMFMIFGESGNRGPIMWISNIWTYAVQMASHTFDICFYKPGQFQGKYWCWNMRPGTSIQGN